MHGHNEKVNKEIETFEKAEGKVEMKSTMTVLRTTTEHFKSKSSKQKSEKRSFEIILSEE